MVKILKYARFLVFLCCFSLLLITPHAQDDRDRYREVLRVGRGSILWADWNPNGQQVLVTTQANEAWLYTVPDFDVLLHLTDVDWGWFSADGRWLIARRPDVSFVLYDAENLTDVPALDQLQPPLFSPDNRYALIRPIDGEPSIRLSDALETIIALPDVFLEPGMWLAWRPDANVLTGFTPDNRLITWAIDGDSAPQTITLHGASVLTEPKWNLDATRLLAHDADQNMVLWDATTGARLLELPDDAAFDDEIYAPRLYWSPDSRHFVRTFHTSMGLSFSLYDSFSIPPLLELFRGGGDLSHAEFSPDGTHFGTSLGIYRTANVELLLESYSTQTLWHPNGHLIAQPYLLGNGMNVVDLTSEAVVFALDYQPSNRGGNARWSPDGAQLLTWEREGALKLWVTESWELIAQLDAHSHPAMKVTFSPDSTLIAASDSGGTVRIWDTTTFELRHTLQRHNSDLAHLEWQPSGTLLMTTTGKIPGTGINVIADDGNLVYIWDGDAGELVATLEHADLITSTAWSPDGRYFASGSGQKIKIWDSQTRELVFDQPSGLNYPVWVSWSPDSSMIVGSGGGSTHGGFNIGIWDVKTGENVAPSINSGLNRYLWTPDSQRMLGVGSILREAGDYEDMTLLFQVLFDRESRVPGRNLHSGDSLSEFTAGIFTTRPSLYFAPTGDALITLEDTHAQLWRFDHANATLLREIEDVTGVQWSPDGQYVAFTLAGESVSVIEAQSGEIILMVENRASTFWRVDDSGLRFFVRQIDPDPYDRDFPLQEEWSLSAKTRIDLGSSLNQLWSNDGWLWVSNVSGVLRLWSE